MIGDYQARQGDILFTRFGANDFDIQLLSISGGVNSTQVLAAGADLGITDAIMGLDLVEADVVMGGESISSGTLLLSIEKNGDVAGLSVQDNDIVSLNLSATTLGSGTAAGSSSLLFDASVAGLSGGGNGDIDGISLLDGSHEESIFFNTGLTVDEGASIDITAASLLTTDPDTDYVDLTYVITNPPDHGELRLAGIAASTFTQKDINDGLVSYHHDGSDFASDSFEFSVDDGDGVATLSMFKIGVSPVNDDVRVSDTVTPLDVNEGDSYTLGSVDFALSDPDSLDSEIVLTVTEAPVHGVLTVNGTPQSSFSNADLQAGRVVYQHDGGEGSTDEFKISATDGKGASDTATIQFNVAPLDDASCSTEQ